MPILFAESNTSAPTFSAQWWGEKSVSLVFGGVGGLIVSYFTRRSEQRKAIDGKILKLIELAMQYPHVEAEEYCGKWPHAPEEPAKKSQYESYCCFLFNLLEDVHSYCWDKKNIDKIIHAKELIDCHACWWNQEVTNIAGYNPKFRAYVQSLIDQIRLERKV